MNEIWMRSIARAGGIEVPGSIRILQQPVRAARPALRARLAGRLRRLGLRLERMADVIARPANRTAPCG